MIKLTPKQEMLGWYRSEGFSISGIARKLKVSRQCVHRALKIIEAKRIKYPSDDVRSLSIPLWKSEQLKRMGLTMKKLAKYDRAYLECIRYFGPVTCNQIAKDLKARGLKWR